MVTPTGKQQAREVKAEALSNCVEQPLSAPSDPSRLSNPSSPPQFTAADRRDIAKLTVAEAFALEEASYGPTLGGYYFRLTVRSDVLRRLVEKGMASKRIPNLLTARGVRVAAALRAQGKANAR